jgi:hypothetical protein
MRRADQRPACSETRVFDALLSMRGAVDGRLNLPHAEEARRAVSKHAGRVSKIVIAPLHGGHDAEGMN